MGAPSTLFILNLSFNPLRILKFGAFHDFFQIDILSMITNVTTATEKGFHPPYLSIRDIESNSPLLQCFSEVYLTHNKNAHKECFSFFIKHFSGTVCLTLGIIFLIFTSFCFVCTWLTVPKSESIQKTFMYLNIVREASYCLYGVYLLLLAVMSYVLDSTFVHQTKWWQRSYICCILSILSLFSITISPVLGLCHHVYTHKILRAKNKLQTHTKELALVGSIYIFCFTATTVPLTLLIGSSNDRYCFSVISERYGSYSAFFIIPFVISFLCYSTNLILFLKQFLHIKFMRTSASRQGYTRAEKNFLTTGILDICNSFPPSALFIYLAVMQYKYTLSLSVRETVISFGFTCQPFIFLLQHVNRNVHKIITGSYL